MPLGPHGGADGLILNSRNLSRLEKKSRSNDRDRSPSSSAPPRPHLPPVTVDGTPSAARSVIGRLLWDHLAVVEADADIVRNAAVYHSILAHHLQDALDDVAVYVRSGGE